MAGTRSVRGGRLTRKFDVQAIACCARLERGNWAPAACAQCLTDGQGKPWKVTIHTHFFRQRTGRTFSLAGAQGPFSRPFMRNLAILTRQRLLLSAILLLIFYSKGHTAPEPLTVLAKVGPWPEISRLIGYNGRLWFANSVKGRNHNSADLYSYDPESGQTRYETQLFSQDAGRPLVAGGVLFWPFEDARFSLGWGHYMATDGQVWRHGTIRSARAFHTHAMGQLDGTLVAATSAWRAGLQVSKDNGLTWRSVYEHSTAQGRVSRIVELRSLGSYLIGRLAGRNLRGLVRFDGEQVAALPGWPNDDRVIALASWKGWLYGLVQQSGGPVLWRSNGEVSERLGSLTSDWKVSGLSGGGDSLWAVGISNGQGWLWQSQDGLQWRAHTKLEGGRPREVASYAGHIFAAGAGDDGLGILWGPSAPTSVEAATIGTLAWCGEAGH